MSSGSIVKNGGSHRILYALSKKNLTSKELRGIVGAINGVARFEGEYMVRLEARGYVEKIEDGVWGLSQIGQIKLWELGTIEEKTLKKDRIGINWKDRPDYDPKHDLYTYIRARSDDALKLPSRIGNKLHYRDGTIKEI